MGKPKHDCFRAAFNLALKLSELGDKPKLVHQIIRVHGLPLIHATVELDGVTFDYSRGEKLELPTDVYDDLFKTSDKLRYTTRRAAKLALKHMYLGVWCEKLRELGLVTEDYATSDVSEAVARMQKEIMRDFSTKSKRP